MKNYSRIRDLREDKDLTQKEAADIFYMHLTQYRRYETGESEVPLWLAIKISEYYNVSIDYIAGKTNKKNQVKESEIEELWNMLEENEKEEIRNIIEFKIKQKKKNRERKSVG